MKLSKVAQCHVVHSEHFVRAEHSYETPLRDVQHGKLLNEPKRSIADLEHEKTPNQSTVPVFQVEPIRNGSYAKIFWNGLLSNRRALSPVMNIHNTPNLSSDQSLEHFAQS